MTVAEPAIRFELSRRLARGKEDADPHRRGERQGIATVARPAGPLVWLHAASLGEARAATVLIDRLLAAKAPPAVLLTTTTVSAARQVGDRLPAGAIHQYLPVDRPAYMGRFLDHWRPDLALWLESEFWPVCLNMIGRRGIPAALLNGRLSPKSTARWSRLRAFAHRLLSPFSLIIAQSEADAGRLAAIGATVAPFTANLKLALPIAPPDEGALKSWQSAVGDRPWWLAASVHPPEIDAIMRAHLLAVAQLPRLLTVIVPRHPNKAPMIEATVAGHGLTVACRSRGEAPDRHVYLADTFGELPLFYRAAPLGLIGGTLFDHGGQNPVEAVRQGCVVAHGPSVYNFTEIFERLEQADATYPIDGGDALAAILQEVLTDPETLTLRAVRAQARLDGCDTIMARLWPALNPLFQAAGLTALAAET